MTETVKSPVPLRCCPFCGSPGAIYRSKIHYPNASWFYYPTCEDYDCIAHVDEQDEQGGCNVEFRTAEEAAQKWNTRFGGNE